MIRCHYPPEPVLAKVKKNPEMSRRRKDDVIK